MPLKLSYYYNVDTQRFCDSDGSPLALEQLPRITLEQQAIFALTCINDAGTPAVFNADDSFSWAADDDWDSASDVLMATVNANINDTDDWADADPTTGKISVLVDANTEELQTALGTSEELLVHGEIKVYANGAAKPYYVGQMDFYARNLVDHAGVVPPSITASYYTKSETDALLTAYLKHAPGAAEATINAGEITITAPLVPIDTEGDASSDDLATINGHASYKLLFLWPVSNSRTVTLKHGTGNILTEDGADYALPDNSVTLAIHDGTNYRVIRDAISLLASYLPLAGGTMAGNIDLDSTHKLVNLPNPSAGGDAVNLTYLAATYLALAGGTMTGAIAMGANKITGLANATDPQDAVTYGQLTGAELGADWQEAIDSQLDFTAAEPASPTVGDRHINTATGTSSETSQSVTANYIYEWNGTDWTEANPSTGTSVMDNDLGQFLRFNGSAWVSLGTGIDHNNLLNLTTGHPHTQYMRLAQNLADLADAAAARGNLAVPGDADANDFTGVNTFASRVQFKGINSPASLSTDQNDYNPASLHTSNLLRLTASTPVNLTGLDAGSDGETLWVHNIGAETITLVDASTSSTAANRFDLSANLALASGAVAQLQYDATSSRWRAISGGGGGAATASTEVNRTLGNWTSPAATLPSNLAYTHVAVIGDYIYTFGGLISGATDKIYRAPVSDPTSWSDTGSTMPATIYAGALQIIGDYVYIFGGVIGGSISDKIYRAPVSDPTSWSDTGSTIPSNLVYTSVAVIGSTVYLYGGYDGSSYLSAIYTASTSTPTTWSTSGDTLPEALGYSSLQVIGSTIYLYGGQTTARTDKIYTASTSTPTTWSTSGDTIPAAVRGAPSAIIGDKVYIFGGDGSSYLSAIYSASLSTPTTWSTEGDTIPAARGHHRVFIIGSTIYLVGGENAGNHDDIYSAPITTAYSQGTSDPSLPDVSGNPTWLHHEDVWTDGYAVTDFGDHVDAQGFRLENLAAPTADTHAVTRGYFNARRTWAATDTGSANSLTVGLTPALTAYTTDLAIVVKVAADNTGAATINVDSVGAKSIKLQDGSALNAGNLQADGYAHLVYDGTNFILLNPYTAVGASNSYSDLDDLPAVPTRWSHGGNDDLESYDDNLVCILPLQENPNQSQVDLAYGNWATLSNTASRVQGIHGAAADLALTAGYLLDNTQKNIGDVISAGTFTVNLWFKFSDGGGSNGTRHLFGFADHPGYCHLGLEDTGTNYILTWDDNANAISTTSGNHLAVDTWYMVTLVANAGTVTMYVNNSSAGTTGSETWSLGNSSQIGIAGRYDGSVLVTNTSGDLDLDAFQGFTIWDAALSSAAITALYNSGNGRFWR